MNFPLPNQKQQYSLLVLGSSLFADYQSLMKIWTHPWAIKLEAIRRMEKQAYDNIEDFLDDDESDEKSEEEKLDEKWNSNSDSSDFGKELFSNY